MEVKQPLRTSQLDPRFKFEISEVPGGESIRYCFQCGKCTATCPVRRIEGSYKPTQIIQATLLGLRDVVLSSDIIWLCAVCYSCTERCPQGVRPTDVIRAIRNLAVREGRIHPFFRLQGRAIVNLGRIFEDEDFVNEMRADMGLPPLPPVNRDEISHVLERTGVKNLLAAEGEE